MYSIFSSYLHENFFALDNKKIKKDILKIKSKDQGRILSNYGGWQSKSFEKSNKNFKNLFDKINSSVKEIEKQLYKMDDCA
jgi:hypothetical protein